MISAMDAFQGTSQGQSYTPPQFNSPSPSVGGGNTSGGGVPINNYNGPGVSSYTPQPIKSAPASTQNPPSYNPNIPHGTYGSGNWWNKATDALMTIPYAVAGFDKGAQNTALAESGKAPGTMNKTIGESGLEFNPSNLLDRIKGGLANVPYGIYSRTQFGNAPGDYNGAAYYTHNAKAQAGINFATSLATPSLPVGKILGTAGKVIGKAAPLANAIPGVEKAVGLGTHLAGAAMDTAKNTPAIYKGIEQIPGLEHFRNPEVGNIIKTAQSTAQDRISGLFNTISDAAKGLSKEDRISVGTSLENPTTTVAPNIKAVADQIRAISDKVGQELVDLKVMSADTFNKYKGQYMAHIADTVQNQEKLGSNSSPLKIFTDSLKERKGILGAPGQPDYIREFQYPAFKALAGEMQTAESTKAMQQIADTAGQKVDKFENTPIGGGGPRVAANGSGLVSMQDIAGAKVGNQFKGIGVPQEVADYLKSAYGNNAPNLLQQAASKAMSFWKLGKTIYGGPGYHARNIMSNIAQDDFITHSGLPAATTRLIKAVIAKAGKGPAKMQNYNQEMKDIGIVNRQSLSQGMKELKPSAFGQNENVISKIVKSPQRFQQSTEESAKLGVYSYFRDQGLSPKEAGAKAEEAIFAPYKIGANERSLASKVTPFYSFTRQMVPLTAKTYLNHPNTLTKYNKFQTGVESLSPEGNSNNALLPDNQKSQIRLPLKDKNGNYQYFDPTYIYPFGNFQGQGNNPEGVNLPLGLSLNPFIGEGAQQLSNKDFYFGNTIGKSAIPARATTQRWLHAYQTFAPNLMPTDIGGGIPTGQPGMSYVTRGGSTLNSAVTGQPNYAGATRDLPQSVLNTFGLKSAPFDPAAQAQSNSIGKYVSTQDIIKEIKSTIRNQSIKPDDKRQIVQQLQQQLIQAQQGQ